MKQEKTANNTPSLYCPTGRNSLTKKLASVAFVSLIVGSVGIPFSVDSSLESDTKTLIPQRHALALVCLSYVVAVPCVAAIMTIEGRVDKVSTLPFTNKNHE